MNHMKFHGCEQCRWGMHNTRRGHKTVRRIVRKFRRQAKVALAQGREPERVISVPYTD